MEGKTPFYESPVVTLWSLLVIGVFWMGVTSGGYYTGGLFFCGILPISVVASVIFWKEPKPTVLDQIFCGIPYVIIISLLNKNILDILFFSRL